MLTRRQANERFGLAVISVNHQETPTVRGPNKKKTMHRRTIAVRRGGEVYSSYTNVLVRYYTRACNVKILYEISVVFVSYCSCLFTLLRAVVEDSITAVPQQNSFNSTGTDFLIQFEPRSLPWLPFGLEMW